MITQILFYLSIFMALSFSASMFLAVYYNLSSISFLPRRAKKVFFQKTIEETLRASSIRKKTLFDYLIDLLIEKVEGFIDFSKIEKKIQRAGIKDFKSVSDVILYGGMYSVVIFIFVYIMKRILPDVPILGAAYYFALPIGFYLPIQQISDAVKRKDAEIKIEAPEVMDLVRQGIGAGLIFEEALKEARPQNGGGMDYLLKDVIAEIKTSGDHIRAISKMSEKINDDKIREFLQQLVIAVDSDKERQIEICAALARNVRELDDVAKNIQIDRIKGALKMQQYTCTGVMSAVFLVFVIYDAYTKFI